MEAVKNQALAPNEVLDRVQKHLNEVQNKSRVIMAFAASNHPEDIGTYIVVGLNEDTSTYSVWTCWNDNRQTLNYGHYNLGSLFAALKVAVEYTHDITPS